MSECDHDYGFTTDGAWGICRLCGKSTLIMTDREEQLYKIFKDRLMRELKIVGYRLVKIE